jgi:hypothetical protein
MRAVSIADNAEYRRFLAFQGMLSAQQRHSFGGCFAGPLNAIPIHWLSTSSLMSTMGAPDEASLGDGGRLGPEMARNKCKESNLFYSQDCIHLKCSV